MPEIIQRVEATLMQVATPPAANVLLPVVPSGVYTKVSDVIDKVIAPAEKSFTKVIAVPTGNATELLAGIVQVLAVVSADG